MKPTLKLVPTDGDPEFTENIIKAHAELLKQDPNTVVALPFSEIENTLNTIDSNFTVAGVPVSMDVVGYPTMVRPNEEKPTKLGEKLAEELDTFEEFTAGNPIVNQTTAFFTGDEINPLITTITSDEDITKLENKAKAWT